MKKLSVDFSAVAVLGFAMGWMASESFPLPLAMVVRDIFGGLAMLCGLYVALVGFMGAVTCDENHLSGLSFWDRCKFWAPRMLRGMIVTTMVLVAAGSLLAIGVHILL